MTKGLRMNEWRFEIYTSAFVEVFLDDLIEISIKAIYYYYFIIVIAVHGYKINSSVKFWCAF